MSEPSPSPKRRRPVKKRLVICGLTFVGLVVAWLMISLVVAYKMTRRPRASFAEPPPSVAWGALEPHRLKTRDGHEIGAWFARGAAGSPSVLIMHGNGGSRRNSLSRAEIFAREGYSVLLISLRAHGDSTGDVNDIGYSGRHDVLAAVDFLERQRPGASVVVHGSSMGAAAAVFAAKELGARVRGYILESPYQDLKTALRNRLENALPPILNAVAYQGMVAVAPLVVADVDRISPLHAVGGIPRDVPVLILAAANDRKARPIEARSLHDRIKDHCRLILFENTDHVKFLDVHPERFRAVVLDFVNGFRDS
jgi:uncharacterized protein